jgi:anti-sigma B factor antagonist
MDVASQAVRADRQLVERGFVSRRCRPFHLISSTAPRRKKMEAITMLQALCVCDRISSMTLEGEIDLATSPSLARRLAEIDVPELVLDCSKLEFIESTGLSVLAVTERRLRGVGGHLRLVHANDNVARLVRLIGFEEWLSSS